MENLKNIYVLQLNHFAVHLKLMQHCTLTLLPFKKKKGLEGRINKFGFGVSVMAQWKRIRLGTMRMQVRSLASLSRLRIQ